MPFRTCWRAECLQRASHHACTVPVTLATSTKVHACRRSECRTCILPHAGEHWSSLSIAIAASGIMAESWLPVCRRLHRPEADEHSRCCCLCCTAAAQCMLCLILSTAFTPCASRAPPASTASMPSTSPESQMRKSGPTASMCTPPLLCCLPHCSTVRCHQAARSPTLSPHSVAASTPAAKAAPMRP